MITSRQASLNRIIAGSGHSFEGKIPIGGNYVPVLRDGGMAYALPKHAAVELEMVVRLAGEASHAG